jgi:hypothetical protein
LHVLLHAVWRRRQPAALQCVELLGAELRFQRLDALEQRWVRGEQPRESDAVAEQHVAGFLGIGAIVELRAFRDAADLLQCAGQALGLAGELHRRRVGQRFPRAAHAGLDHASEEQPDVADEHRDQRSEQDRGGTLAVATAAAELQDPAADDRQHQDPEQDAHQPDVQAHVAIEDVAELVRDDALEFVAIEPVRVHRG